MIPLASVPTAFHFPLPGHRTDLKMLLKIVYEWDLCLMLFRMTKMCLNAPINRMLYSLQSGGVFFFW